MVKSPPIANRQNVVGTFGVEKKSKYNIENNEALIFGHSFTDQIGGQLEAGFMLTNMYEDNWGGENKMDIFFLHL